MSDREKATDALHDGDARRRVPTQQGTAQEPQAAGPPALAPSGPVEGLRFIGTGVVCPLSTVRQSFTIGPTDCDVISPDARGTITRIPDTGAVQVRLHGASGARIVEPGQRFWLGATPVLAVDGRIEAVRPHLALRLGLDRHDLIDEAAEVVAEARPMALVVPEGMEPRELAQAIHEAGPQRGGAFITVVAHPAPSLAALSGATVYVDLRTVHRITGRFARELIADRTRGLRAIVVAAHQRQLRTRLDTYAERVRSVTLTPLAARPEDVPRMLAMIWHQRGATNEVTALGPSLANIARYRWSANLRELREQAPRLLAYLERGGVRAAAAALGVRHQSLIGHYRRIGFVPHREKSTDE